MAEFQATVDKVTKAIRKKDSVIYDKLKVHLDDGLQLDVDAIDVRVNVGVRVNLQPTASGFHWLTEI